MKDKQSFSLHHIFVVNSVYLLTTMKRDEKFYIFFCKIYANERKDFWRVLLSYLYSINRNFVAPRFMLSFIPSCQQENCKPVTDGKSKPLSLIVYLIIILSLYTVVTRWIWNEHFWCKWLGKRKWIKYLCVSVKHAFGQDYFKYVAIL